MDSGGQEEGRMKEKAMIDNKKEDTGKEGREKRNKKKMKTGSCFDYLLSIHLQYDPRKLFRVALAQKTDLCVAQYFD